MKAVFVGHNASRSGAPVVLLQLLRWLREESSMRCELLLIRGGPLIDDYREVVHTSVVDAGRWRTALTSIRTRSRGRLTGRETHPPPRWSDLAQTERLASRCHGADLLYVNTIEAAPVLHSLDPRPPTVLHLHEMSYGLRHSASRSPTREGRTEAEYLDRTLKLADEVIVPSQAARRDVLSIVPSVENRCHVIPEMIDLRALDAHARPPSNGVLAHAGIPRGALVVAACGGFDWRKGIDIFVQVAARVPAAIGSAPVYFVWVGAPSEAATTANPAAWLVRRQFDHDVRRLGLEDRIVLVPPTPDAPAYIQAADLFLLPSREDPFPLVAIEAAALGKPVVCFDSSGTAEMVVPDAGAVVRHLDVMAMSEAVHRLLDDRQARLSLGTSARTNAAAYDVSKVAPQVLLAIDRVLGRSLDPDHP